jgi:hypothetical protein
MKRPLLRAEQRPTLAAPSPDPLALALIDAVGPAYARLALKLASMNFIHGERFVEAVRDFYEGRARLIIAFRHPYGDEPQLLTWALHRGLAREARRLGKPLSFRPHCLFLHGYEVPLWSGPLVRWILPRSGSMPIYHVRLDGAGLRTIRRALREGAHPLALAPEGQASYRSETLPRLERGALQFGFWCAEEIEAAGGPEKVHILPLSVHVRYREEDIAVLESLARDLERRLGFSTKETAEAPSERPAGEKTMERAERRRALGLRLRLIDLALIGLGETYYGIKSKERAGETEADFAAWRDERRLALLDEALRRGEAMLGLPSDGDRIARVYRIRHEGWNRVFPELDLAALPPLERELADRRTGEAWYAMRHMELVDLGFYLDAAYLEDQLADDASPSIGRLAETAYNLVDLASRLTGGDIRGRPNVLPRHVTLVAEPPLEMRSRLADYRADRRAALDGAERDLSAAFHHAIKEYLDVH